MYDIYIYPYPPTVKWDQVLTLISTNGIVCGAMQVHTAKALFNRLCFVRYNRYLCVYVQVKNYPILSNLTLTHCSFFQFYVLSVTKQISCTL
jgi:hypothetical protein